MSDRPRMALRPDARGDEITTGTRMDDIVVKDVAMFRAEQMDVDSWWVGCYLTNGERITWHVSANARPKRIDWHIGELPEYADIDQAAEAAQTRSNDQEGGNR